MKLQIDTFLERRDTALNLSLTDQEVDDLMEITEYKSLNGLSLDLNAKKIGNTFHLSGVISGDFEFTCGRCLESRVYHLDTDVALTYMSEATWKASRLDLDDDSDEGYQLTQEDLDVFFFRGDEIDLSQGIRETVIMSLPTYELCAGPLKPACDKAYQTLLQQARLDQDKIASLEQESFDERWGPLKNLQAKLFGDSDTQ